MPNRTTRVFLVYAEEDYKFRDQLIKQVQSLKLDVEFAEMPNKQPWVPKWKSACRARAFECDGALVLISKKTKQGAGVKWELECVRETQMPVLGITVDNSERSSAPEELDDAPLIYWNAAEIVTFIRSLMK